MWWFFQSASYGGLPGCHLPGLFHGIAHADLVGTRGRERRRYRLYPKGLVKVG